MSQDQKQTIALIIATTVMIAMFILNIYLLFIKT